MNFDCVTGTGTKYVGRAQRTGRGVECKSWINGGLNSQKHTDVGLHNFCRNPDGNAVGVWCYTENPNKEIDFCDVRECTEHDVGKLKGITVVIYQKQLGFNSYLSGFSSELDCIQFIIKKLFIKNELLWIHYSVP